MTREITITVDETHAQLYDQLVEEHGQEAVDADLTRNLHQLIYGSIYGGQ